MVRPWEWTSSTSWGKGIVWPWCSKNFGKNARYQTAEEPTALIGPALTNPIRGNQTTLSKAEPNRCLESNSSMVGQNCKSYFRASS